METDGNGIIRLNIGDMIEPDTLPSKKEIGKLKIEIMYYLETMVEDNLRRFVLKRDKENILDKSTTEFFRKRNRYRASKKLLQYLVKIIDDLPEDDMKRDLNSDHFNEFKRLVAFQSELMQEEDVVLAMEREFEEIRREKKINLWYFRGQMRNAINEITGLIRQADKPVLESYHKLFNALSRLSSFWFYVRGNDEKRVRITDVYIHKLLRVLISRFPEIRG